MAEDQQACELIDNRTGVMETAIEILKEMTPEVIMCMARAEIPKIIAEKHGISLAVAMATLVLVVERRVGDAFEEMDRYADENGLEAGEISPTLESVRAYVKAFGKQPPPASH